MRKFLWCPGNSSKGKAKVAWEVVCLPKDEGGLGIRRLDRFNSALMVTHLWKLLSSKESLWVKWVHMYKLNGRNFWDIPLRGNMSWSWRKILQLRPIIREFVWCNVGNGLSTSLWFDKWCVAGPLYNHVSSRDVFRSGLTLSSHVNDIVRDGVWDWPRELLDKYPILDGCYTHLSNECDRLEWRLHDGTVKHFSVSQVWSSIRPRGEKVPWFDMIWFALNIPRHAFNMWLIINHKLKTQDRVSMWDVSNAIGSTCPLCETTSGFHEHLFFICPSLTRFGAIWKMRGKLAGLDRVSHDSMLLSHNGDSDKSDDDEPSEMIKDQKSIHYLSGSPTPFSDPVVASLSPSLTPTKDSDSILEETDTHLPHHDSTSPEVDDDKFDPEGDILFLEGLLNDEISSDLPPLEDQSLLGNVEDLFNRGRGNQNLILNEEDIDGLFQSLRVYGEKPLESLDCISKTFDMTITDPLFDFDSEFTLNSDDPIFGIHNEESDESETETIMDEVQNHSLQSTAQIPPPYEKLNFDLNMPKPILTFSHFRYGIFDSHRVFDILGPRLLFSLSYNFGLVLSKEYLKFLSLNIFLLGDKNEVFDLGIIVIYVESEVCKSSTEDIPTLFALMKL
ncbi:reverse transcriptase zinc-binding domain-containing protein [Tanacetum coccineum]